MLPLLALALLLAAPSGASAARGTVRSCETAGRSLAGSAQVRVYERDDEAVIACSLENGRRVRLGDRWLWSSGGSANVNPLVVSGRMVAWTASYCGRYECESSQFGIANVHSGNVRLRRKLPHPGVTEVVLRPNGSAAWIEADGARRTLHRRDPSGEALLAEGDVRGLALSPRSTLYWTEAGVARSATLEPAGGTGSVRQRRPRCGDPGYADEANPWVRVWDDGRGVYSGCSLETGRVFEFGESYTSGTASTTVGPFAAAGRLVAWYDSICSSGDGGFSCEHGVNLVDMRTGEWRRLGSLSGSAPASDIVLKRNGSGAWVEERGVHLVDRRGDRILGPGRDLALSKRSLLYWTLPGGAAASAPID